MHICNKRYQYTLELLQLDSCRLTAKVELATFITTPFRAAQVLGSHPDQQFAEYIVRGIRTQASELASTISRQHVKQQEKICHQHIRTVMLCRNTCGRNSEQGEWLVRLTKITVRAVRTSSFGVIPKASQPSKWRLILDLSSPHGSSVNDSISKELASLQYTSVDQAVKRIVSLGKDCLLAKIDVKQAYRNVPVHPQDRPLLGMR